MPASTMRLSRVASAVNRQLIFFRPMRPGWKEFPIPLCSPSPPMPQHFGDFLEANGQCAGVFLVKQRVALADVIEALVLVWAASEAEEWNNRIVEIPQP